MKATRQLPERLGPRRWNKQSVRSSSASTKRKFDSARMSPPVDLPARTRLEVKASACLLAFSAIALYAWLNLWMGFNTLILLTAGGGVYLAARWLMGRLSARLAPESVGSIREGSVTWKLTWATIPFYLASILLFAQVVLSGWSSYTFGWQSTPIEPELALGACVVLWLWTLNPQVHYVYTAKTGVGRNRAPAGRATTAVVVVHGIGSPKPGGPLHGVADPIEEFLYKQLPGQVLVRHHPENERGQQYVEFIYEIKNDGRRSKQRVVATELLWSNVAHRASGLRTFGWLIRSLPLFVALVFAPDRYDLRHGKVGRLAYRFVLPVVVAMSLLQPATWMWTLIVLAALMSTTIFRKTNLIGDVQMAATDDAELVKLTSEINSALDAALAMADRVIVVGHSQGGYLSYNALKEREPDAEGKSIQLVGVGSGLKPIWVLKNFKDGCSILRAWSLIIGGLFLLASLAPVYFGFLSYEKAANINWFYAAAHSLVDITERSPFRPARWDWGFHLHSLQALIPDYFQVSLFILGIILMLLGRRKAAFLAQPRVDPLPRPAAVRRWIEITSSVDSVGRLAFPHLFEADVWDNPTYGNSLLDHISYFRRSSPVTWYLACYLFAPITGNATPQFRRWANYLDIRAWKARSLATVLGLGLLSAYAINRVRPSTRGIESLAAQITHPGYVFIGFLMVATISPALTIYDRYRTSFAMRHRPIDPPPRLKSSPAKVRDLLFVMWAGAAVFAAASGHYLVRYSPMTSTEIRILPLAPVVLGAMIFGLAAALAVGYRPPFLLWASTLVLAGYWSSYLPGEGQIFVFLGIEFTVFTIISIASLKAFSHDIELADSVWPGYYAASR